MQQERREKDVESKLSEEKPLEEVLGRVLKASPTLSTLFLKGQRRSKPFAGAGSQSGKGGGAEKKGEAAGHQWHPGPRDHRGREDDPPRAMSVP